MFITSFKINLEDKKKKGRMVEEERTYISVAQVHVI